MNRYALKENEEPPMYDLGLIAIFGWRTFGGHFKKYYSNYQLEKGEGK